MRRIVAILSCWVSLLVSSSVVGAQQVVEREVVQVSYSDLQAFAEKNPPDDSCLRRRSAEDNDNDDDSLSLLVLTAKIAQAFGPDGLGFLEVTDIPQDMVAVRSIVLNLAQQLAQLPTEELDSITLPETFYTIGWSHGKEQFQSGEYDTRKGSFYLDPFRQNGNVYPPSLQPLLEDSLQSVSQFMSQIGLWIAQLCDVYLWQEEESSDDPTSTRSDPQLVYKSLQTKINTKARLLYYFPTKTTTTTSTSSTSSTSSSSFDDWCGWHKDHGSLTALLPGQLFGNTNEDADADSSNNNTHAAAGLYIQTRDEHHLVHVKLPPTSLGFQLGETVEVMSRGKLRATPHAVKASRTNNNGGRASLAVFLQPEADQVLPLLTATADASLQARWRPTFGVFQQATTKAFN